MLTKFAVVLFAVLCCGDGKRRVAHTHKHFPF